MIKLYPGNVDAGKHVILINICVLNSFRKICPLNFSALRLPTIVLVPVDIHSGFMMVMRDLFFKVLLTYEDAKWKRKNVNLFHMGHKAERFKLYWYSWSKTTNSYFLNTEHKNVPLYISEKLLAKWLIY